MVFLIADGDQYYLTPKEDLPFGFVQHKKHIIMVMCLAAVAWLCFDTKLRRMWDGKLGIWPFAHQVLAKNNRKNSPKGTLE